MRTVNHQSEARLAQPAERKALNLVAVGSSPTVGVMANYAPHMGFPNNHCTTTKQENMVGAWAVPLSSQTSWRLLSGRSAGHGPSRW